MVATLSEEALWVAYESGRLSVRLDDEDEDVVVLIISQ